ncbi:MAG: tryptophan 2,3-dioxygenase [Myxococcales bacterium]|nr:tryptophan 2,3-dioxygenase [Myxococcales bacterium]
MSMTYLSYLKVPELLSLQERRSQPEEHDEMLFIVIHQAYELWFKQILHELEAMRRALVEGSVWEAMRLMRRTLTILKVLVHQVDILETMTPLSFNQFRSFLADSSGFQSVQFRELEILCGVHTRGALAMHPEGSAPHQQLLARMEEQTLWEAFCAFLRSQGLEMPTPERDLSQAPIHPPTEAAQEVLLKVMREREEASLLCELLVDFDEGLQEWRYRHVKMVERTIGHKPGTGGSAGVGYLLKTLHRPVFPDLWAIRNKL